MPIVKLSLSVDDKHLHKFSKMVEKCKKAGMKVEQQLESIGIVTGSIDSDKADSLNNIKGVAHVEEERQIQLPPPESDVQ